MFGLALAALILLAVGLDGLELKPGQVFNFQDAGSLMGSSGQSLDVSIVAILLRGLLIAAFGLLPFYLIYMLIDKKRRKRLLADIIVYGLLLYALNSLRQSAEKANRQQTDPGALLPMMQTGYPEPVGTPVVFSAAASDSTVTIIALILGAVGVGLLVLVWWLFASRRHAQATTVTQLATQAEETIEELLSGKDLRETILLCYRRMTEIAAKNRNLPREVAVTPHEFEAALISKGLPSVPVHELTSIFEDIRYGDKTAGEDERRRAVGALRVIAAVCRAPEQSA